jgi:hypothetical protein
MPLGGDNRAMQADQVSNDGGKPRIAGGPPGGIVLDGPDLRHQTWADRVMPQAEIERALQSWQQPGN